MDRRCFLKTGLCALWACALGGPSFLPSRALGAGLELKKGALSPHPSPYFIPIGSGTIRCLLCPRRCEVDPGERGYCEVRENRDGIYYSLVYGNPCAVHVDPIEKKPFFHVLPTTRSFSIATAGCNFDCKFCQNWEISQARPEETRNFLLAPAQVVQLAAQYGCASVASTYVEPTIFMEYMLDIAKGCREAGLLKVMHSNGFVEKKPLEDLAPYLDAACIDLKGIRDAYYREMTEGWVQPVLDTLKRLKEKGIHTEIVNLLIPGKNDADTDLRDLCRWIVAELGPDVPVHFTRFYPRYKLQGLPPTPVATLERAHATARREGLRFPYIGNVPGHPAESTFCPRCNTLVIRRTGYRTEPVRFRDGHCAQCGTAIPGIWKRPGKPA
ncbi:MAG: Radical domain protein [Desulfacinum sp.]|nr:Radical domain protein [Desulfacinum sp.]